MTQEQQRIAIATACGWKGISEQFLVGYAPWHKVPYSERINTCPINELEYFPLDNIPNYPSDLNAMHEAEKTLSDKHGDDEWSRYTDSITVCATAAERAEAFLKTLELWQYS